VEEVTGGIVVRFKGLDAAISWPKPLVKYISHATESPWGTKSAAVAPVKIASRGAVLSSPWSVEKADDSTVQPPVTVVAEAPVGRSPWGQCRDRDHACSGGASEKHSVTFQPRRGSLSRSNVATLDRDRCQRTTRSGPVGKQRR
jgi:hypothetical protein